MKHIERIKTILKNVTLSDDWEHEIKFDRERLLETILYFFYDQLIDIDYTKLPKVDIHIDDPDFTNTEELGKLVGFRVAPTDTIDIQIGKHLNRGFRNYEYEKYLDA